MSLGTVHPNLRAYTMSFESFVFDLSFPSDDEDELYVAAAHVTTEGIDVEPFRRGFVEGHIGY